MAERQDNQWKVLTGLASGVMGLYLGMDILYKRLKGQQEGQAGADDSTEEEECTQVKTYDQHIYNTKPFNPKRDISLQKVNHDHNIFRIVLTGGPCGGKTTSLNALRERYQQKGFRVIIAPELPTLTMQGGGMIIMGKLTTDEILSFQTQLMQMQINLEDYYVELAKLKHKDEPSRPTIVFFDRGVCDPRAYQSNETWQAIMDQQGWNEIMLRDTRYDAVIHLVTVANGAEDYYTSENNVARYETVEMAVQVDNKLQNSWTGHPHHFVIGNGPGGFQEKLNKVFSSVDKITNSQEDHRLKEERQRKFLVYITDMPSQDIAFKTYDVQEVYLKTSSAEEIVKIRRRGNDQKYSYIKETKLKGQAVGRKVEISARQWSQLLQDRDPALRVIKKRRSAFVYNTVSFVIDTVEHEGVETNLMRIECLAVGVDIGSVELPPFLRIDREVTHDDHYTTLAMAGNHSEVQSPSN